MSDQGSSNPPAAPPAPASVTTLAMIAGAEFAPELRLAFVAVLRRLDELERALEGQCPL